MLGTIIVRARMVSQMLSAINLATSALHDCVGLLAAGFKGTSFVHFNILYCDLKDIISVLYNRER